MTKTYDLVILGGGPGGYVAAIRAAQLGLSTAIVEKEQLGGTCLHQGCIPTKSLLRSAEVFQTVKESQSFGVLTTEPTVDFSLCLDRKNKVVEQLHKGIIHLMKKGKIDVYNGYGMILGASIFNPLSGSVSITYKDKEEVDIIIPKNLIIATGSKPKQLPNLPIHENIMTSNEALQMSSIPKSILIVGGGVIGMEWASLLNDFGTKVTIIEYASQILPTEDTEIAKELTRVMKKKGMKIVTNAKVIPEKMVVLDSGTIQVIVEEKGIEQTYEAEKVLISVGRQANIEKIGIENTSIQEKNGFIDTNSFYQTNEKHIYAIGDCIDTLQLAHVASHEGVLAVEHIVGKQVEALNYTFVPRCVYTSTEVASVGLTEQQAKEKGYAIKVGKFSFKGIGKALVYGNTDGFVKMITDAKTNDLLGVHLIGPKVTEMISEAALAQVLNATAMEIASTIHPHPSISEAIHEAALDVEKRALHQ